MNYDLKDISTIAQSLFATYSDKKIWLFEGEMGAGKTTLIKAICVAMGISDSVSSPTFAIINEYLGANHSVYHFDCYRIENLQEADDLGFDDYFYSEKYCFIEWASKIRPLIPENHLIINIKTTGESSREIEIQINS